MDGTQVFNGRRIVLLGAVDLEALARPLRERGALVNRYECAAAGGARAIKGWLTALLEGDIDDVLLTTAQGVRLIVELGRQASRGDEVLRALARARKIAPGPAPVAALAEFGLSADLTTGDGGMEALLALLGVLSFDGRVVGVASSGVDRGVSEQISARGGTVRLLDTTNEGDEGGRARQILDVLCNDGFEDIVFGAAGEVKELINAAHKAGRTGELFAVLKARNVLAVGASAAEALAAEGVKACSVVERGLLARLGNAELARLFGSRSAAGRPAMTANDKSTLVIVGGGMVALRLCELLVDLDREKRYQIVVFCEEPRPAYDRVHLTHYFSKSSADELLLAPVGWYREHGIRLLLGEQALRIDRERQAILSSSGEWVRYDTAVLATGGAAFVPSIPGVDKRGVFVYRTIEDLDGIRAYAKRARRAIVMGGGLLGLEAAKAVHDLGLETHVVELSPRLMPRQLDSGGARLLLGSVEALGVRVHLGVATRAVLGDEEFAGLAFKDREPIHADMLIISAGIRPRDELAREAGLLTGDRGGIVVDDGLKTSDPAIYALGDCALHRGTLYGLVAPGYQMADACARSLMGQPVRFEGADQSAKLKLLGVDVASLGDPFHEKGARTIVYEDLVKRVYKKLVLSEDCSRLFGAVLVGDAAEYATLLLILRGALPMPTEPEELLFGARGQPSKAALSDAAQVCSCNNVTKQQLCGAIRAGCGTVAELKAKTRAGTGCGGCMPLVTDVLNAELRASGKAIRDHLCEHFSYSRQELYQIVKIKKIGTFEELVATHGTGAGCEVCKPTAASILASVHNEMILKHGTLQDSNDRFLANIQRGGLYSVVPRIPGGEITPEKLIKIGEIAKKYRLYTKITGGQRIDLLGARVQELPDIWEELVLAGFESGHAYGKAMRTVKSCVGSTWCRYGVQDAVSFAIRVEERYKGIRAPHKMKAAVSGCIRECAEAQSKDFGLIATEQGWNLYVCGNGGAKPRHAELLAADLDEATALKYIDRFIMLYIQTADRLTRTAAWLEKLDGGIEYLKEVIVHDKLALCAELDREMQFLVDTYRCEWAEVVRDPEKRASFRHFVNSFDEDQTIEFVDERGQRRPKDWSAASVAPVRDRRSLPLLQTSWVKVARETDVPQNGGVAVEYGGAQIALFNFVSRGEWYACQNMCPHKQDMVLARGILGDQQAVPKVACPQHKKTFSLKSGECLSGEAMKIRTFPVKVQDGWVYLELPREKEIGGLVALKPSCGDSPCGASGAEPIAALDAE